MRLEHHLVGGYVRYISPHIIIIIIIINGIVRILCICTSDSRWSGPSFIELLIAENLA